MLASLPPVAIALIIVLLVAIVGALIALLLNLHKFHGFREIASAAQKVAKVLDGNLFRDAGDLVISGNFGLLPTVVRFSNKENVPGINLRVGVPANFTMWIASRSAETHEGRAVVRTGDTTLDSRFVTRSDDPGEVRVFTAIQDVPAGLRQLACSSNTFVAISEASLELSELEIPKPGTARHILDHLETIAKLAAVLKQMPNADRIRVQPLQKDPKILGRAAIAIGAIVAVLLVLAATQRSNKPKTVSEFTGATSSGVLPRDASAIAGVEGWRTATEDDFNPNAVSWIKASGLPAAGRIPADFAGRGTASDVAYVLVGQNGSRRLVLLENGEERYDTPYPAIAIAARVPKENISGIEWTGMPPAHNDGDGLLVVRAADDPKSGLILFTSGRRIVTGVPANYQAVRVN
jgi:hypothetical protein